MGQVEGRFVQCYDDLAEGGMVRSVGVITWAGL